MFPSPLFPETEKTAATEMRKFRTTLSILNMQLKLAFIFEM
jgi:hypothetical protein